VICYGQEKQRLPSKAVKEAGEVQLEEKENAAPEKGEEALNSGVFLYPPAISFPG
jgi:predicted transcriptional regulator